MKYLFVILKDFEEFDCQESNNYGKSQLDLYLEKPRISCFGNLNSLVIGKIEVIDLMILL